MTVRYEAGIISLMSRRHSRPQLLIGHFCSCADKQDTRQRLNLRWGVMPFRMDLQADPDANVDRTFALLKRRDLVQPGDLVIVVSDIRPPNEGVVRSVQIRHVP